MQDTNWPISKILPSILVPILPDIEEEVMKILLIDDLEWKVNILKWIVNKYDSKLPARINEYIDQITKNKENEFEDLVEICNEILLTRKN